MKRRPRIILKLCMFLLLGAIVNVAVAWGFAIWSDHPFMNSEITGVDRLWTGRELVIDPMPNGYEGWMGENFGVTSIGLVANGPPMRGIDNYQQQFCLQDCAGWPARSMTGFVYQSRTAVGTRRWLSGAVEMPTFPNSKPDTRWHAFPTQIIWPGFAINTVFYAAVLWGLLFGPGKIRRFIRARRGQCPACGYPVGTSDVCTECGKPVTPLGVELTG